MSGREWKPGDIAVGYDAAWYVPVVRHHGSPDYWSAASGEWPRGVSSDELDYRPLVVIDPEDDAEMSRLSDLIAGWSGRSLSTDGLSVKGAHVAIIRDILREFADPTPTEPTDPTARVGPLQVERVTA